MAKNINTFKKAVAEKQPEFNAFEDRDQVAFNIRLNPETYTKDEIQVKVGDSEETIKRDGWMGDFFWHPNNDKIFLDNAINLAKLLIDALKP